MSWSTTFTAPKGKMRVVMTNFLGDGEIVAKYIGDYDTLEEAFKVVDEHTRVESAYNRYRVYDDQCKRIRQREPVEQKSCYEYPHGYPNPERGEY